MKAGTEGAPVDLTGDLKAHVEACAYCASTLPAWIKGCAGMKQFSEESDLMKRGALGDSSVLRRSVADGTALFQPAGTDDGLGLMVIVGDRSPFDARRVKRITRADFESLDLNELIS